ncbi:hypothetical protein HZ326_2131 [Fusarium oxysporum f. sp. albedinis]|nr:hypothetical protein HZ326_2131 [Fusarium oxysporum f. sp. albedinis]
MTESEESTCGLPHQSWRIWHFDGDGHPWKPGGGDLIRPNTSHSNDKKKKKKKKKKRDVKISSQLRVMVPLLTLIHSPLLFLSAGDVYYLYISANSFLTFFFIFSFHSSFY